MDKKIIDQYGSEILSYKLKTARQKKRAVKKAKEKFLLKLHREQNDLRKQQRALGYIELDSPIVRGWKRYFVLREDIARSRNAFFYQQILDKINTIEYCNRKDFKRKKRYNRSRKQWKSIEQMVKQPEHADFVKLNFSDKQKALFEEKYVRHKWKRGLVKVYVFKEQWRFVFRIRQNIITKVRVFDAELERRENEIDSYLEKTDQADTLSRLLGYRVSRWRRWDNHPKASDKRKCQMLSESLKEWKNELLM